MYRPGVNSLREPERSAVIDELLRDRPELAGRLSQLQESLEVARRALASGDYEQMGGDPDLYKYFCQRYRALVRETGFVGVVLPRTAFNAKGSEGFREWLYVGSATHRIDFLLNNKRWIFDTHPQYSIALVVVERSPPTADHHIEVAGTAESPSEWTATSQIRRGPPQQGLCSGPAGKRRSCARRRRLTFWRRCGSAIGSR